jgi:hypothetical protein
MRHFEADGYRWLVREVEAPPFDRRGGRQLIFDGELIMRRVRLYPADWYQLSDEDLYAVSLDMRDRNGT